MRILKLMSMPPKNLSAGCGVMVGACRQKSDPASFSKAEPVSIRRRICLAVRSSANGCIVPCHAAYAMLPAGTGTRLNLGYSGISGAANGGTRPGRVTVCAAIRRPNKEEMNLRGWLLR